MITSVNGNPPQVIQFLINRVGVGALSLVAPLSLARPGVYDWIVHSVDARFVFAGATGGGDFGLTFKLGSSIMLARGISSTAASANLAPGNFFSTAGVVMAMRMKGSNLIEPSFEATWSNAGTASYTLSVMMVIEPVTDQNCRTESYVLP